MTKYLGVACVVALSGCSVPESLRTKLSADPTETKDEKRMLIAEMRQAYECHGDAGAKDAATKAARKKSSGNDGPVSAANCQKIVDKLAAFRQSDYTTLLTTEQKGQQQLVLRFMDAGTTLSDVYCDEFFRSVNLSARKRQFGKGLATDTSTLVAGALNLVKAGSAALTASTVGFNALNASFRNYDESFMVDADLAKMRRLVLAAQDSMKLQNEKLPPRTFFAAESKVIRYAGLCSFLGMKDLLNDSIATKTADIEKKRAEEQRPSERPVTTANVSTAPAGAPGAPAVTPDGKTQPASTESTIAPLSQPSPPG
ncbi:hypothetical protein [Sphingomonas sp. Leaf38]|jgi:negative regulator of replication initiation|uniref:hypothetical protein n=1 Tax=Sphingomonas sp. Leaf38 TaxID=1736217 RepID=UPI000A637208|nr:hypothetical protein [Sphingomonas sp. Leaf38]